MSITTSTKSPDSGLDCDLNFWYCMARLIVKGAGKKGVRVWRVKILRISADIAWTYGGWSYTLRTVCIALRGMYPLFVLFPSHHYFSFLHFSPFFLSLSLCGLYQKVFLSSINSIRRTRRSLRSPIPLLDPIRSCPLLHFRS